MKLPFPAWILLFASAAAAAEFHVSPTGRDDQPGTKTLPFATLEKARDAVRALHQTSPAEEATVWLEAGIHRRSQTFELGASDTHTTYRAAKPGAGTLSAALEVPASAWTAVAPEDPRLDPAARGKVFQLNLDGLGVTHCKAFPGRFNDGGGLLDLYCDGEKQPWSRWPNSSDAKMKRVLDKGVWSGQPKDRRGGVFEYDGDRPLRWMAAAEAGQLWVAGFWRVPWDFQTVRVKALDTTRRTLAMAEPVQLGIGSKYAGPEGSGEEPWHVINLLEEIDMPGELCVDFITRTLYFWPPSALKDASISIADMETPLIRAKESASLTLRGLNLEGGLGEGVELIGGRDCVVAGCQVTRVGRNAIVLKDGRNHQVLGNDLTLLGHGGVIVSGGDRKTLTPCGHVVDNNHISRYALAKLNYSPGIGVGFSPTGTVAVGCRITHNRIHDSPHAGILYGGNDNLFEFNEVYDVVKKTFDMGAFYTTSEWISGGNVLRHNFVHHAPEATGFYLDDGDSGDRVEGNIAYRVGCGPFIGGGHDNLARGNLAVDCGRGAHLDTRGVDRGYNLSNKNLVRGLESINAKSPPWSTRFPSLATVFDGKPELPTGSVIESTVAVNCESALHVSGKKEHLAVATLRDNVEVTLEDMGFLNASQLDFRMKADAPVFTKVSGFKPIPFEKIGLYSNEYRPSVPPRAAEFRTLKSPKWTTRESRPKPAPKAK
ncbi:MAG: hypothetical protein CFE26_14665 [Verrucomicrobiales bacterium VVV1]|nr:MAG: hypothetical protein CFE26_14665 [Verrucomicrobiales bacterium VVV1]